METVLLLLIIVALIAINVGIIADRFTCPFQLPVIREVINISGRRDPSYEECIDQWVIDHQYQNISSMFGRMFQSWDTSAKQYLEKTWLWKAHKEELYLAMRSQIFDKSYKSFEFIFTRSQTRYWQINYQRTAYKVENIEYIEQLTLDDMLAVDDALEEIGYETTRQKYFAKNQRKLMTKDLRRRIIERDNYTCQICGKTVESNLQVLCSKCNLSKGTRKN